MPKSKNSRKEDAGGTYDTKVKFLMRKEVTIVTLGSLLGAFGMHLPGVISDVFEHSSYLVTLLTLARVVGSSEPAVGFLLHLFVATIIGIVTGILLYKAFGIEISHLKKGLLFGLLAGGVVFAVFAIPVSYVILAPSAAHVMHGIDGSVSLDDALLAARANLAAGMLDMLIMHIIWGLLLGSLGSYMTRRFGANYYCRLCSIEFSNTSTLKLHIEHVHESDSPSLRHILILGGGYGGVGVLNHLQKKFHDRVDVAISLVSESNFFLHTPMLPEMATGTIESRHIATPIRQFCHRARFYQAGVLGIDLAARQVTIRRTGSDADSVLEYDYLVVASGMRTNFYGNKNVERGALTIKTLDDAIAIRNRLIGALEEADQEAPGSDEMVRLATFVVVGGGFSGVETVGELNSFVRDSVSKYYHNIPASAVRVILISATDGILPEIGNLGAYAMSALKKAGVTFYTNTKLTDYDADRHLVTLGDGTEIRAGTLIWAAGNMVDDVISNLDTEHHRSGRITVNKHLSLVDNPDVFALGDCAFITDPRDGTPYPPTAQHAIQEAKLVSENLANRVMGVGMQYDFVYDTKGSMAKIGNKDGVALLMGRELRGLAAWFVWKQYYLSTLPTAEKKIRVALDWMIDLFFPRDITRLSHADVSHDDDTDAQP